jgi:hypothetical protein
VDVVSAFVELILIALGLPLGVSVLSLPAVVVSSHLDGLSCAEDGGVDSTNSEVSIDTSDVTS